MPDVKLFCTDCWSEVRVDDVVCPSCGSDVTLFNDLSYEEKLIKALMHFEPQTAIRAAEILAMRKSEAGAQAIADAFANRSDLDPIMACAFINAIASIVDEDDTRVASGLKKRGKFNSAVASVIIERILNK